MYWVEAQPGLCSELRLSLDPELNVVIEGAAWSESGLIQTLFITNNSQSSSLLELHEHLIEHPSVQVERQEQVSTIRLDEVLPNMSINFANFDIQGAELAALEGMGNLLQKTSIIYTEVNNRHLYLGCPLVGDLDAFLAGEGFKRIVTSWTSHGWGDAIYTRDSSSTERLTCIILHHFGKAQKVVSKKLKEKKALVRKAVRRIYGFLHDS